MFRSMHEKGNLLTHDRNNRAKKGENAFPFAQFYQSKITSKSIIRSIDLSNGKASVQRNSIRMVNSPISVLIDGKKIFASSRNVSTYGAESRPWFIPDQKILGIQTESINNELNCSDYAQNNIALIAMN